MIFRLLSLFGCIVLLCFWFSNCIDNNRIPAVEITKRIQPIIEAKSQECGNRPEVPLFFTQERPPGEVESCERDMLVIRCPFRSYPWSCVRIF
jgi:hypothetical protein